MRSGHFTPVSCRFLLFRGPLREFNWVFRPVIEVSIEKSRDADPRPSSSGSGSGSGQKSGSGSGSGSENIDM